MDWGCYLRIYFYLACAFAHIAKNGQRAMGVDADAGLEVTHRLLDQSFEREIPETQFPDFPATKRNVFSDHPDLFDYLKMAQ